MYFSKLFVPTTRQDPSDAELISHKLMVRSGMIKKTAAGIYNWLPLGYKVLKKVENIIRKNGNLSIVLGLRFILNYKKIITSLIAS